MGYTKAELIKLRDLATQLHFQDDVDHWNAELKKLEDEES